MSTGRHTVGAALLLAVLAGCTAGQPMDPDQPTVERPYEGLAFDISEVPPELRVPEPKDARGVSVCELLTDTQLAEVGLRADTGEEFSDPGLFGRSCTWELVDDRLNFVTVGLGTDAENPVLPGLYVVRSTFARFEPVTIAGHPGVTARRNPDSACEIDIAPSDDQLIIAGGNARGRQLPDPCARSLRMIELILSNLPPRR